MNAPRHPIARMLGGLLARVEVPTDYRLNPHLAPEDIGETIRVAIDCLEQETGDTKALKAALVAIAETATQAAKG